MEWTLRAELRGNCFFLSELGLEADKEAAGESLLQHLLQNHFFPNHQRTSTMFGVAVLGPL